MYGIILAIHVIASIFLIAVILLQAGRGGGLSDTFAGSQMQSMFGTKSTSVLTKLTTACAVIFIITCVTLAFMSSRRTRSILDNLNVPQQYPVQTTVPVEAQPTQASQPEAASQQPVQAQTEPQGGAGEAK